MRRRHNGGTRLGVYISTAEFASVYGLARIPRALPKAFRVVYQNNSKNGEFGKEAPQNFDLKRVTIAGSKARVKSEF